MKTLTKVLLGGAAALTLLKLAEKKRESPFVDLPPDATVKNLFFSERRAFAPPGPAPAPVPRQEGPELLQGALVALPGERYRVALKVSAPLSWIATESKVQKEAEKRGFSGVSVTKSPPPGWPGGSGDYYLDGVFAGSGPTPFERSGGGGQVQISSVWRG